MIKNIMLLAVAVAMAASAPAQSMSVPTPDAAKDTKMASTWEGYLVDAKFAQEITGNPETAMKKAAEYSRATALKDASGGFGLITDGRWVKFDEASSQKALDFIKSSKVEKGIRVIVQGTMSGEALAVTSIKEAPPAPDPSIN